MVVTEILSTFASEREGTSPERQSKGKRTKKPRVMRQEELKAKLESYDLKRLTIQRLLVVRDIKRNEQVKIQRFCNELRDYSSVGVLDISNDVRDRIDDCLQAVAADVDIYEAFVSRASEEIVNRAVRDEVIKTHKGMKLEKEHRDYGVLRMLDKLSELKYKLRRGLAITAQELEAWAGGAWVDVDALTDELAEHIDALGDMKRICEEILRMVSDKEFDD